MADNVGGRTHPDSERELIVETVMNGIEKRAGFYRGYLTHDRSPIPLAVVLGITIALWLFVYLIGAVGHPYKAQMGLPPHATSEIARQPTPGVPEKP